MCVCVCGGGGGCIHIAGRAACPTNFSATPSLECKALYSEMESSLGEFNTYNIYDQCPSSSGGQVANPYTCVWQICMHTWIYTCYIHIYLHT
eukprot:COSAG03_NODE_285_length_9412_cov_63.257597_7_plen_92_part_00